MTISIGLQRKPLLMFGRTYYDKPIYYLHLLWLWILITRW